MGELTPPLFDLRSKSGGGKSLMDLFSHNPLLHLIRETLKPLGLKVFLVGGALRDSYLSRRGYDFDFAVDGDAVRLARHVARQLHGAFVPLDEHQSARVVKKIDGETWTFDFTQWRSGSIQGDLKKRDFTINAMAIDFLAHAKIKEIPGAQKDLKAGVVRMVSKDVFKDDPLRLMRAFSLQAVLDFKIEKQTYAQIKKDAHLVRRAAMERIREELFKVLASPRAHATIMQMDKSGLWAYVLPQMTVMVGVYQGGYHHLDVWAHSLEVLGQLEKRIPSLSKIEALKGYLQETIGGNHKRYALLKMAALLHDIGKPETRASEGGRTTFHGHEHVGERITRLVARHLKVSLKERSFLEDVVRLHLRPGYLSNFKRPTAKALYRYYRDAQKEAVSIAVLSLADQAATRGPLTKQVRVKHHAQVCQRLIDGYFKKEKEPLQPRLLTGHDLINILKIKPSPLFGKILSRVEEAVVLGKIKTKPEALGLARKIHRHTL